MLDIIILPNIHLIRLTSLYSPNSRWIIFFKNQIREIIIIFFFLKKIISTYDYEMLRTLGEHLAFCLF
jgi:hypothetical protein